MKVPIDGGSPELVAWGLRNPFALAFSPDSRLFVTENSYRGSRPIHGTGDLLWEIKPGIWYGWPDFHGQRPVDEGDHHKSLTKGRQKRLLASLPNDPPKPAAILEVHSSSNGFDFSRNAAVGYIGHVFIAQFGDMAPDVGKVFGPVGFKVVRVDVTEGVIHDFATNKGKANGPGSWIGTSGFERPVAARFDPLGTALYVVDFGVMTIGEKGPDAREETGVLWKITKEGGQ
jgi:glucose/arabinose dehydrogenase